MELGLVMDYPLRDVLGSSWRSGSARLALFAMYLGLVMHLGLVLEAVFIMYLGLVVEVGLVMEFAWCHASVMEVGLVMDHPLREVPRARQTPRALRTPCPCPACSGH